MTVDNIGVLEEIGLNISEGEYIEIIFYGSDDTSNVVIDNVENFEEHPTVKPEGERLYKTIREKNPLLVFAKKILEKRKEIENTFQDAEEK